MLLTDRQVPSANIDFSKTQISKILQLGGVLGRLLGALVKAGLPLMENAIKALAKSVLIPLGLTTTASAADAGLQTKNSWFRVSLTFITENHNINYFKERYNEIFKFLEKSCLFIKDASETTGNEAKE